VFSFQKLTEVDVSLGPEMKSTGEIMGIDRDFSRALYKAMVARNLDVPIGGKMIATIADQDKEEALLSSELLDSATRFTQPRARPAISKPTCPTTEVRKIATRRSTT